MIDTTGFPRLARSLLGRRPPPSRPPIDLEPASVYEVVTRQMVDDLVRELTATRQRVDSLFYLVAAAVLGEILSRIV